MTERLAAWVYDRLQKFWVTLLLVVLLVTVVVYSVDEANWIEGDQALTDSFVLGVVFGWMLARSRFSMGFVLFYSLFISLVTSVEGVANIVPSTTKILTTPFPVLVEEMNLSGFTFLLRLRGWIDTFRAGENIEDTGLFGLLLGFILSAAGIWLLWTIIRQRRALNGLLPLGILIAINIHLSRQPVTNYMIFLFCAALLTARNEFSRRHEDWQDRRVDYPDQLGLDWGTSALVLAALTVLIARLGIFLGTPEGWRAVSDLVNRTRERTSDTAERLFSGVNPPPPPITEKPQVFVNTPDLSTIGTSIPQGYETIMWVTISDPAPVSTDGNMEGAFDVERIHYWRSQIYSRYTGQGWEEAVASEGEIDLFDSQQAPPSGRYFLRQEYQMEAIHRGTLFSVNDPVQTTENVDLLKTMTNQGTLLRGQADQYQVISAATDVTANMLASAPVEYPQDIEEYLQLPDSVPSRVRELAQRIVADAGDPYHKAVRLQDYLRSTYPYDLSLAPVPGSRDVVDYFLFDMQRGFCSHYASAMAVMLRSVGVPARVVTGYAMGEYDPDRGAFRVPVSASHAWVEVYFTGLGWVEFEPTAYRPPITYPADAQQEPSVPIAPLVNDSLNAESPWMVALVTAAALALLVLPFLLLRLFSARGRSADVQVEGLYRQIRKALAWAGLPAGSHVTPDEYLLQASGTLEKYPQVAQALGRSTRLYRELAYSPHPPDADQIRKATQLWQQSAREWLLLWLRARWNSIVGKR